MSMRFKWTSLNITSVYLTTLLNQCQRECVFSNPCPSEQCYRGQSLALPHHSQDEVGDCVGMRGRLEWASFLLHCILIVRVAKLLLHIDFLGVLAAVHFSNLQDKHSHPVRMVWYANGTFTAIGTIKRQLAHSPEMCCHLLCLTLRDKYSLTC